MCFSAADISFCFCFLFLYEYGDVQQTYENDSTHEELLLGTLCGHHIEQSMDHPGKVANSCSWSAEQGKMNTPLSPFAPENLVSRDGFSRPVPRQPAHPHTQAESGAYSRDSSRFPRRRPFIYLNRHTPLGHCQVYRVTQLRTNGVHCQESAGTGPVVLKVAPVTGAAILQVAMDQSICASLFPHPLMV